MGNQKEKREETHGKLTILPSERLYPIERKMSPKEIIAEATEMARALKDIVKKTKTSIEVKGHEYLFKEAWETLGKFSGCTAKPVATKPSWEELEKAKAEKRILNVFWARVEILRYGECISAGEAFCTRDEENWKDKPDFQLLSMAQTRAISKAFRNCLSWIVVLAGYKPTTAEEMTDQEEPQGQEKAKMGGQAGQLQELLAEYCQLTGEEVGECLKKVTTFKDKKTGEMVPGKSDPAELSPKQLGWLIPRFRSAIDKKKKEPESEKLKEVEKDEALATKEDLKKINALMKGAGLTKTECLEIVNKEILGSVSEVAIKSLDRLPRWVYADLNERLTQTIKEQAEEARKK